MESDGGEVEIRSQRRCARRAAQAGAVEYAGPSRWIAPSVHTPQADRGGSHRRHFARMTPPSLTLSCRFDHPNHKTLQDHQLMTEWGDLNYWAWKEVVQWRGVTIACWAVLPVTEA